jgi:5-methylthioadenosine/S-adenosylhomocysteine deaminase
VSGLAVTDAELGGRRVGLRAAGGRIAEIGPGIEPREGDEAIDAGGMALVPGLLNGHTHAAMTLFRGYADDLPLMEWLEQHIWPAEARLEAEDVYWGTRLACAEMIRTGTVGFWDMYWQPGATARAVLDSGLRATIGAPLIDAGADDGPAKIRADAAAGLAELAEIDDPEGRIGAAFAPHAIYTVSDPSLEWIGEESHRLGLPVHIHLSETRQEVDDCLERTGLRPAALLDRLGVLGPRTVLAHCVWLDEGERELIAAAGATVVSNPVANMKLAVGGTFDLPAARAHGIHVGLGTDGAGSNNALDLFADVKHFALAQKALAADAAVAPAAEALAIAQGARAPLLGAAPLEAGAPADFLLVPLDGPALGLGSLEAGLVYATGGSIVDTTVVAGRVLMRGGVIEDEAEIVARARERAARLGLAEPIGEGREGV